MRRILPMLMFLILLSGCNSKGKGPVKANGETEKETKQKAEPVAKESDLAKQYAKAVNELSNIGIAIEAYFYDQQKFPEVKSLKELAADPNFVPSFIGELPYLDPWGNEYLYLRPAEGTYRIGSAGSDGVFNGFEQAGNYELQPGKDIIYIWGGFQLWPKL